MEISRERGLVIIFLKEMKINKYTRYMRSDDSSLLDCVSG